MWGSYATVAVYRVQRAMPCANQSLRTAGRILFEPPRAGAPHLRGFTFESLARHGACCRAGHGVGEAFQNSDSIPTRRSSDLSEQRHVGELRDRRSVSSTTSDALREPIAENRGPNFVRTTPCRSPAPPRLHF